MEYKIVITGPAAVGKTTAITALSDRPPVSTDEYTTDELSKVKETTTVAFDFGEIELEDDLVVRVYGTPGQDRFRHMWEIVAEGALGFIILLDATRPDPVEDLDIYVSNFRQYIDQTSAAIGITRLKKNPACEDRVYQYLEEQDLSLPVIPVDARNKEDMTILLLSLLAMLEYY